MYTLSWSIAGLLFAYHWNSHRHFHLTVWRTQRSPRRSFNWENHAKIAVSLRFHNWTVFLQLNFNVAVSRYFKWYFVPTRKVWKIYIITDKKRFLLKRYIQSGIHCSSPAKFILLVWHYCLVQENLMSALSISPQHWNLDSYVNITFISTSNTGPTAYM